MAILSGVLGPLVIPTGAYGSSSAHVRTEAPRDRVPWTYVDALVRIGNDGAVYQHERVAFRQLDLDKVAIAQVVKETKDGGRLTRAEAQKIIQSYGKRNQPTDAQLLDEICKRSPGYPPCKDR